VIRVFGGKKKRAGQSARESSVYGTGIVNYAATREAFAGVDLNRALRHKKHNLGID
jgi:hypothetical protein